MSYLSVKNFERFQHYTDRRPPWVKFYVDLLRDREMAALPKEARLLYCLLLLVAAKEDNHINANPAWIADEVLMPLGPVRKGIASLLESGHLLAVNTLANPSSNGASPRARPRARGEAEAETETERQRQELPVDKELGITALLAAIGADATERTPAAVRSLAGQLPPSSLAKVRESLETQGSIRDRGAYAVGALQSELREQAG